MQFLVKPQGNQTLDFSDNRSSTSSMRRRSSSAFDCFGNSFFLEGDDKKLKVFKFTVSNFQRSERSVLGDFKAIVN